MAQRSSRRQQDKSSASRYLPWVSHLLVFVFGAVTGVMLSQIGNRQAAPAVSSQVSQPAAVQTTAQTAAIQQLQSHLAHEPDDVEAHIQLGNAYFDSGNYESAILHYAKALDLQPQNPDVIVDLGIAYREIGQSDVGVKKFREALAINPRHVNARYNLGLVLMSNLKDFKGAIAAWDTLLANVPNHPKTGWIREQIAEMKRLGGS